MEAIFANFQDRLRHARNSIGLTQPELAKKLGVSYRTYTRYELGNGFPDSEILQKIGILTGCNMNWLIMGTKSESPNIESILENSIENKIRKNIQLQINNFQHEIIFLHYALEECVCISFDDLLKNLQDFKISSIALTLQHAITKYDKESAIKFLEEMESAEKNFILSNIQLFRRMIWENMTWFNKMLKMSPQ